jgi:hypothetical protein
MLNDMGVRVQESQPITSAGPGIAATCLNTGNDGENVFPARSVGLLRIKFGGQGQELSASAHRRFKNLNYSELFCSSVKST